MTTQHVENPLLVAMVFSSALIFTLYGTMLCAEMFAAWLRGKRYYERWKLLDWQVRQAAMFWVAITAVLWLILAGAEYTVLNK